MLAEAWLCTYVPRGIRFCGQGSAEIEDVGDAFVVDVGEGDLLVQIPHAELGHGL